MAKEPQTGLAVISADKLNELATRAQTAFLAATGAIAETLVVAAAIQELRTAVLPLVPRVLPLVGTQLGFRTDRDTGDKGRYSDQIIADVLVEAVARGLKWTGNEFNIISGRLYITKEGYSRLVHDLPGMTDLELTPSVPGMRDGGAVVKYKATWKLDGKAHSLEREIPVRLNSGMGADAAIGKATRKMLASIHARVTGSVHSFADGDAEDVTEGESKQPKADALADKMAAAKTVASNGAKAIHPNDNGIDEPPGDAPPGESLFGDGSGTTTTKSQMDALRQ